MPRMAPYGIPGLPKFGDRLKLTATERSLLERTAALGETIAALFPENSENWLDAKRMAQVARDLSEPYNDGY